MRPEASFDPNWIVAIPGILMIALAIIFDVVNFSIFVDHLKGRGSSSGFLFGKLWWIGILVLPIEPFLMRFWLFVIVFGLSCMEAVLTLVYWKKKRSAEEARQFDD